MEGFDWRDHNALRSIESSLSKLANRYAPEWIKITDKVPPNNDRVLLYCPTMKELIVGYRTGDKYWAAWFTPQSLPTPTHWLQLPMHPD